MDELLLELGKVLFEKLVAFYHGRRRRALEPASRTVIRYGGRWKRPGRFR